MVLGSHNSWSYLPVRKWWMNLIKFTARCQDLNIKKQYDLGVECFDLRVKFINNFTMAHGLVEYNYSYEDLMKDLEWLNSRPTKIYIRVLHEVRRKKEYTKKEITRFQLFCDTLEYKFPNLKFWCGRNLYTWDRDYTFNTSVSCLEKYASVCAPKYIDDWWPRWYAKFNNSKWYKLLDVYYHDDSILLLDFINYGH